jgi:hypothetical protein
MPAWRISGRIVEASPHDYAVTPAGIALNVRLVRTYVRTQARTRSQLFEVARCDSSCLLKPQWVRCAGGPARTRAH